VRALEEGEAATAVAPPPPERQAGCTSSIAMTRLLSENPGRSRPGGIGAIVLLAGGSGMNDLTSAAERSVLDLPMGPAETLFSLWQREIERALPQLGGAPLELRIVGGAPVWSVGAEQGGLLSVQHIDDPHELRGTGGILRDIAADYSDDTYLLVSSGSTMLLEPLDRLVTELAASRSDVAFFADNDDSAGNIMLIRCGCLRTIASVGFVDLKEQALPHIASASSVAVIRRPNPVAVTMRTAAQYLRGLRLHHLLSDDKTGSEAVRTASAFSETWRTVFQIVERDGHVEPGARLHDSVVLSGARVGRGAAVIRSVVCSGAVVPAKAMVVDEVVRRARIGKTIASAIGVGR